MNISRSLTMRHIVIGIKSERKEENKERRKDGRKKNMICSRNK